MAIRHVAADMPGIRRVGAPSGFRYIGPGGRRVRDRETLDRIRALAVPPAWTDVWICPLANGHIQATGRDGRGRKQYRYHAEWTAAQSEAKFERLIEFGRALPRIRRRILRDLEAPSLSRPRVLATVVRLLEQTLIRVGNDEYARANHSYGLTTLRNHHVNVDGRRLAFAFRAKSGIYQHVEVEDRVLARTVKACQELPGQLLFEYLDPTGTIARVDSSDVNEYLREIGGGDFTAKDFRTWAGTMQAARLLAGAAAREPAASAAARKRQIVAVVDRVARALNNTRSVCRKCYIHSGVLDQYLEHGTTLRVEPAGSGRPATRTSGAEAALLTFLAALQPRKPRTRSAASHIRTHDHARLETKAS